MGSLQDKLAAAQRQKANGGQQQIQAQPKQRPQQQVIRESDIDSLDDMVFGAPDPNDTGIQYEMYPNGQKREIYDPSRELEEIKNGQMTFNNPNAHLPSAILEDILKNPLIIQPTQDQLGEVMNEDVQARSLDIIDKLEARDNSAGKQQGMYNENVSHVQPGVDAQQLAQLIESIIDKKLKQYSTVLLTESRKSSAPQMNLMTIGNKFKFMDNTGAVYECQMKYIGQGKVKKK